jgi:hypothetical protein
MFWASLDRQPLMQHLLTIFVAREPKRYCPANDPVNDDEKQNEMSRTSARARREMNFK